MSAANIFNRLANAVRSELAQFKPVKKQLYRHISAELNSEDTNALKQAFAAYFGFTGNGIYSPAKKCFRQIEDIRNELLKDNSVLLRDDFGAGSKALSQKKTTVGALCRSASMPAKYAELLYWLIIYNKPKKCLELGTCLGISAAYQACALQRDGGKLFTIEGDPQTAESAKKTLEKLNVTNAAEVITGKFSEILPGMLQQMGKVDFAFIDGHHNSEATLQYYSQLKPYLSSNSIIIFDDIDWSDDMQYAWKILRQKKEFSITITLGRLGLCMYNPTETKPPKHLHLYI